MSNIKSWVGELLNVEPNLSRWSKWKLAYISYELRSISSSQDSPLLDKSGWISNKRKGKTKWRVTGHSAEKEDDYGCKRSSVGTLWKEVAHARLMEKVEETLI